MTITIPERVANGVAWLDERIPTWHARVTLEDLDMADSCRCVLGLVFSDRVQDGDGFGFVMSCEMPALASPDEWAVDHGFDCDGTLSDWAHLHEEWSTVIESRRLALV